MKNVRSTQDEGLICGRCGLATGNTTQGHRWRYCKVTRTFRRIHHCCPGHCEIEEENADTGPALRRIGKLEG